MISQGGANDQVAAILAGVPGLTGRNLDSLTIEPLVSLTNRTYKVTIGAERFVLRIAGTGTERYIDRSSEANNARLAASIGVGPEVVHDDPTAGIMVTRFIPDGIPLRTQALRDREMLGRVARLLKRLHGSGLPFAGEMRLFPKLDQYLQLVSDGALLAEFDLIGLRRDADPARQALERRKTPLVPSHVDPLPDNFVASGEGLFLVDWEYSAMAEEMWDLAAIAIEAEFDGDQDRLLLEAYFGSMRPDTAARFLLYRSSLHLLAAAWAVLQMVDGNPNGDFRAFAGVRLSRHLALTRSAAYRDALAALGP